MYDNLNIVPFFEKIILILIKYLYINYYLNKLVFLLTIYNIMFINTYIVNYVMKPQLQKNLDNNTNILYIMQQYFMRNQ